MSLKNIDDTLAALSDRLPLGSSVLTLRPADRGFALSRFAGDAHGLTGVKANKLRKYPGLWLRIVHPKDRGHVAAALSELGTQSRVTVEYRIVTKKGEERYVREDLRCLPGEPRRALGVIQHTTPEHDLRQRVASLERRLLSAQRTEALGKLSSEIAHDFNNLLTTIIATTEILEHELELDDHALEDLVTIRNAATRGGTLVGQILDFAGHEEELEGDLVNVAWVARALEPILSRTLGEAVDLKIEASDELWAVRGDVALVEQIMFNLVVNAREALKRGGTLTILTANVELAESTAVGGDILAPGRYVTLAIHDTGAGITERVRRALFDRHASTKRDRNGGVGLAAVRGIVRQWQGGVAVESSLGRSTTFRIYLPVHPPETHVPPEAVLDRAREQNSTRVLLVESRAAVRTLIERALTRAGYSVVAVGAAREALEVFDRVKPRFDLVIIDAALPGRSGKDVHEALSRRVDGLPVVFIADRIEGDTTHEGVWLTSPLSPVALYDAVEEALAKSDRGDADGKATKAGA